MNDSYWIVLECRRVGLKVTPHDLHTQSLTFVCFLLLSAFLSFFIFHQILFPPFTLVIYFSNSYSLSIVSRFPSSLSTVSHFSLAFPFLHFSFTRTLPLCFQAFGFSCNIQAWLLAELPRENKDKWMDNTSLISR